MKQVKPIDLFTVRDCCDEMIKKYLGKGNFSTDLALVTLKRYIAFFIAVNANISLNELYTFADECFKNNHTKAAILPNDKCQKPLRYFKQLINIAKKEKRLYKKDLIPNNTPTP